MRSAKIIAGLLLASCLVSGPASAAGLLGGLLGGSTSTGASTTSSASSGLGGLLGGSGSSTTSSASSGLGGVVHNTVNGLLGGSGLGVSGLATVTGNSASTGTQANATLLGGGGSTLNVGLHDIIGGNSNLGVTLPGSVGALGGLTSTVNGLTENGGSVDTLLGNVGLSGNNGGLGGLIGGNGGLLGNGDGPGTNPPGTNPPGTNPPGTTPGGPGNGGYPGGGSMFFANFGDLSTACRKADLSAIAALLQNRGYSARTPYNWRQAANVQLVPIKLCPQLRADVRRAAANNGNIRAVQSMAASDPLISASLGRTRYGAGSVLGVDQSNGTLSVYVY